MAGQYWLVCPVRSGRSAAPRTIPGAGTVGRPVRYVLRFLAICGATAVGVTVFAFAFVPQMADLVRANRSQAAPLNLDPLRQRSVLYDSSGNLIGPLPAVENRSQVTLDQIPALVKQTILAVEDENFYTHKGVNVRATLRALSADVGAGSVEQGGSTITMQLVKIALPAGQRDLKRKTQEAFLAWRLEDTMTKDEIFERDVNSRCNVSWRPAISRRPPPTCTRSRPCRRSRRWWRRRPRTTSSKR